MAARRSPRGSHRLRSMATPNVFRCRTHKAVVVALFVPGVPSCAKCGRPLQCVGYAVPEQPNLFGEVTR
jgi:hypothetical protein